MTITSSVNNRIRELEKALSLESRKLASGPLFAGVDLGTAYIATAVVDSEARPVAGVLTRSRSYIRDGLVLDYMGAVSILRKQIRLLHESGFLVRDAASAYPPGTAGRNARVFHNVLEAVGLEAVAVTDEPSAAGLALEISDGAVVDIGGGTTGISVMSGNEVVYTADEPTGGIHVDLVLSGHFKLNDEKAEAMKCDPSRQAEIFPLIRPVFEKMASIVHRHLLVRPANAIYLVGGTSEFPGIDQVIKNGTGLEVYKPVHPILVTPLGIALACRKAVLSKANSRGDS